MTMHRVDAHTPAQVSITVSGTASEQDRLADIRTAKRNIQGHKA